jgi:hypothetical protein
MKLRSWVRIQQSSQTTVDCQSLDTLPSGTALTVGCPRTIRTSIPPKKLRNNNILNLQNCSLDYLHNSLGIIGFRRSLNLSAESAPPPHLHIFSLSGQYGRYHQLEHNFSPLPIVFGIDRAVRDKASPREGLYALCTRLQ